MANDKHIYTDAIKCVSEVFNDCVPNFSVNAEDQAVLSQLKLAEPVIYECIDEIIWDWICQIVLKDESDRTDFECKILNQARLTISLYIAHLFIQTPGMVTDSGDYEAFNGKMQATTWDKNKRNCWIYLNRYYDALEVLIFKCICPNLELMGFSETSLKVVDKFCRYFIQSPSQFVECENLTIDGRLGVFLKLQAYFKLAEREIKRCICPGFFDFLKSLYCKVEAEPNPIYDELISMIRAFIANHSKYLFDLKDSKTPTKNGMKFINKHPHTGTRDVFVGERERSLNLYSDLGQLYLDEIAQYLADNKNEEGFENYLACFGDDNKEETNPEECLKETNCSCGGHCHCQKPKPKILSGDDGIVFF